MQFRVLGPLDVRVADRLVPITAPKHRALLAALLVHANEAVSVDQLIEYLWGEQAPATARSLVKVYVSQVRRLLFGSEVQAASVLVTQPPGYRLQVAPDQLDVFVFEQLVGQAETEMEAGRSARADVLLREGLSLWRGQALADVPSDWLQQVEAPRLAERRMEAIEARIEAGLALGRHRQLVGELEALVAVHPLRERLHGQLMLALYRSGRRADALAVYRAARTRLAEGLGLDPDPSLQRLERAILSDDASLILEPEAAMPSTDPSLVPEPEPSAPDPPASSPRPPAAFQLPPDTALFTGREDVCEQLSRLIETAEDLGSGRPMPAVAAVAGKAGVGKTALVVHIGHRVAQRFPDGVLYADLRGVEPRPLDPADVLGTFLLALGVEGTAVPDKLDDRVRQYRTWLADRRVLVVLDNAADEAQVRALLPSLGSSAVLVTSRRALAGLEATATIVLDVLPPDQARHLLTMLAGEARVSAEIEAAEAICARCGHLPLAVRVAGARLATKPHWTLGEYAHRLADERRRLSELVAGDLEVRSSVALTYDHLDHQERRAVRLLGLIQAPDFAVWAPSALLGVPFDDEEQQIAVEDLVERLVDVQFLEVAGRDESGQLRYRFHDLLRDFARERLREDPEETQALALVRLLDGCLVLAQQADDRLGRLGRSVLSPWVPHASEHSEGAGTHSPIIERIHAWPRQWLEAERIGMAAAVDQAVQAGHDALASRLVAALAVFFELRGDRDDWLRIHMTALAAARRAEDRSEEAWHLLRMGNMWASRWGYKKASTYLRQALELFRELGDRSGAAYALQTLGSSLVDEGRNAAAAASLEESLALFEQLGDNHGRAITRYWKAAMLDIQCRYEEAIDEFHACLAIFRALRDRRWEAVARSYLGITYRNQGRFDLALACIEETLQAFQEWGDRPMIAECQCQLAPVLRELGRFDEALTQLDDALILTRAVGYRRWEGVCLYHMGRVLFDLGRYEEAEAIYGESLAILVEVEDHLGWAVIQHALGELARARGQLDAAAAHFDRCLPIFKDHGYERGQALLFHDLGGLQEERGHPEEAVRWYAAAAEKFHTIGHEASEGRAREDLRRLTGSGDRPDPERVQNASR